MLLLVAFPAIVRCQNTDLFNYDTTRSWDGGMDYGPKEWDQVECDDIEECVRTVFFITLYPFTFLPLLTSISNPLMFSHTHPHSLTVRMAREISHGRRMEPAKK